MGPELPRKQDKQTVTFKRWWISTALTTLRESRELSVQAAAKQARMAPSIIHRAERGENVPTQRTLRDLLVSYRADQATQALLLDLSRQPDDRGWWHPFGDVLPADYGLYISCEAQAQSVHNYETSFVPGMLQTERYAEATIRGTLPMIAEAEVRRRLEVRMQRQAVLAGPDSLQLWAIIDEAAIRRSVGGFNVMREQLDALAQLPATARLQVVPYGSGAHPGMTGAFVVMRFRDPRAPTAVFAENAAGQFIVDADADLSRYGVMWDRLATVALSEEDSARLIAGAARGTAK